MKRSNTLNRWLTCHLLVCWGRLLVRPTWLWLACLTSLLGPTIFRAKKCVFRRQGFSFSVAFRSLIFLIKDALSGVTEDNWTWWSTWGLHMEFELVFWSNGWVVPVMRAPRRRLKWLYALCVWSLTSFVWDHNISTFNSKNHTGVVASFYVTEKLSLAQICETLKVIPFATTVTPQHGHTIWFKMHTILLGHLWHKPVGTEYATLCQHGYLQQTVDAANNWPTTTYGWDFRKTGLKNLMTTLLLAPQSNSPSLRLRTLFQLLTYDYFCPLQNDNRMALWRPWFLACDSIHAVFLTGPLVWCACAVTRLSVHHTGGSVKKQLKCRLCNFRNTVSGYIHLVFSGLVSFINSDSVAHLPFCQLVFIFIYWYVALYILQYLIIYTASNVVNCLFMWWFDEIIQ